MKVTEDSVNHNALLLIEDAVGCPFEFTDEEDKTTLIVSLSYIKGVLDMAKAMKEIIKM